MPTMKCPGCGHQESRVIDSRPTDEGASIRRRRECAACSRRFTSYETIDIVGIMVVKKDKSREPFDRNKILGGIKKACEKRPVSIEQMQSVVSDIEIQLQNALQPEVTSMDIGELVELMVI